MKASALSHLLADSVALCSVRPPKTVKFLPIMSSNLVPLDRLQDLIRDFMNTAAANAISQQQLRPSDVTRVPDHSTDTSPIDSQSSPQDDFATLRTSISTNSGLGATTIALHPAAEAGQTNFLKVDAAPKDGSIGETGQYLIHRVTY